MTESSNHSPAPIRIAIWIAVSSTAQAAADKISLDDQASSGQKFSAAVGGHVVRTYVVPGHTRDLVLWSEAEEEMDAYRQLRQDCEAHAFDVLYALDVDRLGRDPALSNQVISLVERSGAEIYLASAPHPIGHTSTGQRYIHAIQAVRAKEDQTLRVRRMSAGIRARVAHGLPANHWPIGYIPIPGPDGSAHTAELDPHTAPAVQLATALFTAGESYAQILHALNASPYRPPRADAWGYSTVHRILNNDHYAGFPTWGDTIPTEPSTAYPILWPPDVHAAVIRERARRSYQRYQKGGGSPFAGLVICARCGGPMTRNRHRNRRTYSLRCSTQSRKSITGRPCHPNSIAESALTRALTQFFADIPTTLDVLVPTHNPDTPRLAAKLETLSGAISDLEHQRQRLALALASGKMDAQMYRTTDDQLLEQLQDLTTQADNTRAVIAAQPDHQARRAALLELSKDFSTMLQESPPQHVRTTLQNIGIQIEVDAGKIVSIAVV